MKAKKNSTKRISSLLTIGLLFWIGAAKASVEHFPGQIAGNNIQGDSILIEDDKIGTSYWSAIEVNSTVKNMVLFEMDEESFNIPSKSGIYRVDLTIAVWDSADVNNTNPTTTLYQTLEFDYDTIRANKTPFRSLINFSGYHRMKIEVTTLTLPSGVSSAPLRVYGEIIIDRTYSFDCNESVNFKTGAFPSSLQTGEFTVEWNAIPTIDEYDLEWTFYDSLSQVGLDNNTYLDFNPLFQQNATRITTDQTAYTLQLLYPSGALFFRIRAIHYNAQGIREFGKWSAYTSSASTYANFPDRIEVGWHEEDYNWQSRILYAEEGKNVPTISYFDGSQRGRQEVTLSNTDTMTLISQTIYDHHGRPAVSVLPAPTFQSHMRYDSTFALNSSLEVYTKTDFDQGSCNALPASMSTSAGASKYFSPLNNRSSDGFNQFIPDAKGYSFAVTEYTPDQTGRIKRQGGVGDTLGIRNRHDTQYLYGKPDQKELDRLFGNEVGNKDHYFKNAVISPDNQISVSYLDAHGRTIATALAGEPPSSVDSLLNKTQVDTLKRDLLNNIRSTYELSSTYSLIITTKDGAYEFNYDLDSTTYQPSCVDTSICYDCLYDVVITVSDNCDSLYVNDTLENYTINQYDTLCSNLAAGIHFKDTLFNLPIGEYKITKTLSINQEALNYYTDHYLSQASCLPNLDSLIEAFKAETDFSTCGLDCDSCLDQLGTQSEFIDRVKQELLDVGVNFTVDDSLDLVQQYAQLIIECDELCGIVDECAALLSQMRADVSPGGQYAFVTFDSIVVDGSDATSIFYQNAYQNSSIQYTNESGQADTVLIAGVSYTPNQLDSLQFIRNWNPAWADTLIKYFHPEYCYLDWCLMNQSSNAYDAELYEIETLSGAIASGLVDSLGNIDLDDDPFFQSGGKGADCQASMDSLLNHLNPYDTSSLSLIEFIEQQVYGGGFPCDTSFGEGTDAENNLAWELLRNFYLGFKDRIKKDKQLDLENCHSDVDCIGDEVSSSCTTSPYRTKIRRVDNDQLLASDYSTDSLASGQADAQQQIADECTDNCANNVNYWLLRLSACSQLDSLQRDTAITRMQAVCVLGCDAERLFGSSTTALDINGQHLVTSYGDTSFVQILSDILGGANYCDIDCSANMIDFPEAYESQYQGPKPIQSKNACLCDNLAELEACYTADSLGYASLSEYLLQFSSTPLSIAEIDTLKRYCGEQSLSRYLPQQMYIPPYLECGICKSCDEVQPFVTAFNAICTDTSSLDYPELRARYLNQQLGLNVSALEYDNFLAQCSSNPFPQSCGAAPMLCPSTPYEKAVPDTSCYSTLMAQITIQAQLAYQEILDSLRETFINEYLNSCLNSLNEKFELEGTFQEYHYTLYYYDLAGNLVKTIPPKGVTLITSTASLDSVAAHRADLSQPMILPQHTLPTVYVYNSLNEVIWEDTPDADSIQYWYDQVGRLVVSQDGRERDLEYYSYTRYDELGRIAEVGTIDSPSDPMSNTTAQNEASLASWLSGKTLLDLSRTFYDESPFSIAGVTQYNLRSRVAVTTFSQNLANTTLTNYTTASHYSYDVTGNVNTLVQEYKMLAGFGAVSLKQIDYDYDYLSGNVNAVYYQRDQWDQFTHRYQYDANNRLSKVFTSLSYTDEPLESPLWEQDAHYDYYLHGPLARTELGNYRVQGMDYAYNLQGWIKGVNAGFLDANRDMGQDGKAGGTLSQRGIARDAYGYTLGYFEGDYLPIGGASINFELNYSGSTFNDNAASLYNGNIRHVVSHNKQLSSTKGHTYEYDQLHRIKSARMWDYNGAGTYSWAGSGTGAGSNKYYTFYQYDPNGNLTNLLRYDGTPTLIDNLGYVYYDGTNRLSQVGDGHSGPEGVLNGQAPNNYVYDKTGNLVEDVQSDATIYWNSYGKVPRVVIGDGLFYGRVNDYHYGPDQNRWLKSYVDVDSLIIEYTYYVRDAQGNVLSTYQINREFNETAFEFTWQAQYLYGSARIGSLSPNRTYNGVFNSGINLPDSAIFAGDSLQLCLGWKRYEISNHLGNVTATVSDRKRPVDTNADEIADYYNPTILSATDYYPFGMDMPNRTFNAGDYRFGFNGKEADRNGEWGNLNHYDYGFRIYNPGIAKFLSVDPLRRGYPSWTPYAFAMNRVIDGVDLDGLEFKWIGDWYEKNVGSELTVSKWDHGEEDGWVEFGAKLAGNTLVSLVNGVTSTPSFVLNNLTEIDRTQSVAELTIAVEIYLNNHTQEEIVGDLRGLVTDPGTYEDIAAILLAKKLPGGVKKLGNSDIKFLSKSTPGSPGSGDLLAGWKPTKEQLKWLNRGRANEAKVLKAENLKKNNKAFTVIDPKTGKPVKTIPDSIDKGITEVKDTKTVSNTAQIRAQRALAKKKKKKFQIITGTNTHVSKSIPKKEIKRRSDLGPKKNE